MADICNHNFVEIPAANVSSEPLELRCEFCNQTPLESCINDKNDMVYQFVKNRR